MKKTISVVLCLSLFFVVIACGSGQRDYYKDEPSSQQPADPALPDPGGEKIDLSDHPALQNRKIIYTVHLGIVTTNPQTAYQEVISKLNTYDAFVESEEITSSTYKITLRVKSDNLTDMVNSIQNEGETIHYQLSSEDITNKYSTLTARIDALQAQHTRILELIAVAENLSDILVLENQRAKIETELNEIYAKLNNYDSLIEYSTIHLTITKIRDLSELLPKTATPVILKATTTQNSVMFSVRNPGNYTTTITINVIQQGKIIKEITTTVYSHSVEEFEIDGLKPGQRYRIEAYSVASNHSRSNTDRYDIQTDNTFFTTVRNVFISSLKALVIFFQYIGYMIVAIIPFAIAFTIIGIPSVIIIKNIKQRRNKK